MKLWLWEGNAMTHTMDAVYSGTLGINRAALECGMPLMTLKDQIAGRVVDGTKMGAKPFLTKQEEQELVNFLINCSKMGFGKTRKDILSIVQATLMRKAEEEGKQFWKNVSQG